MRFPSFLPSEHSVGILVLVCMIVFAHGGVFVFAQNEPVSEADTQEEEVVVEDKIEQVIKIGNNEVNVENIIIQEIIHVNQILKIQLKHGNKIKQILVNL